jgi:hypothetical protein
VWRRPLHIACEHRRGDTASCGRLLDGEWFVYAINWLIRVDERAVDGGERTDHQFFFVAALVM